MAITKITKTELLELTSTTGAVRLPSGTTAERPSTNLNAGDFRYNTDDNKVEYYDGSSWFQIDDESLPPVPSENFNTLLYSGNGGTQSITGAVFQPDLVWVKRRSSSEDHVLFDSVRGVQEQLRSNSDGSQSTKTNALSSFDSSGFTTGANNALNTNGQTYVGWCFKGGGAPTATNSAGAGNVPTAGSVKIDGADSSAALSGSIAATKISANTKTGFSIITWTGTQVNDSIDHGLNAAPNLLIVKDTSNSYNWYVFTKPSGTSNNLRIEGLNTQNAASTQNSQFTTTTSLIENLTTFVSLNTSGATMLIYAFHDVAGYQKIGTYTGNNTGGLENQIIQTGFEPAWLLIRNITSSSNDWIIVDNKRSLSNPRNRVLEPNKNNPETEQTVNVNFLTNGFELTNGNSDVNDNGDVYLYWAIAADPDTTTPTLANSFKTNLYTGNGNTQTIGGHLSGAAQFNGSNSLIDITGFSNFASTGVSISAWINVKSFSSGPTIFNLYSNNSIVFGTNSSGKFFRSGQGTTVTSAATMSTGTWHHVVMTANTSGFTNLYLNGFGAGSGDSTTAMYNSNSDKDLIGAYGTNSQPMDGSIDQVRIYNSVLTASQVSELYNETSSTANTLDFPTGAGCIAAYPLNTNSNDLSGNYNGTDSNITYSDGPGFKPTFIWMKAREATTSQALQDSVRGVSKFLASNGVDPQYSYPGYGVVSYNNDGWTLTDVASGGYGINGAPGGTYAGSNAYYVGWAWKGAVNLPTINTDGSITSIVSANPASGFSVVKYKGTGSAATIGHGLDDVPEFIIVKNMSSSAKWRVYVSAIGATKYLNLSDDDSEGTASTIWNDTTPTEDVFSIGSDSSVSANNDLFVAYCFHSVSDYCQVGSYTGSGNPGNAQDIGFQPGFIIFKNTDGQNSWWMFDSERGDNSRLFADLPNGESTSSSLTTNSTGFSFNDGNSNLNQLNHVYIYLAIK